MTRKKKIVVTGATGFIGAHIARRLVKRGDNVILLVRSVSRMDRVSDILEKVSCVETDFLNLDLLASQFADIKPDGIVHLATSNIMSGVTAADEDVIATNFIGTKNLIDAAVTSGADFFINTGSFLEYGLKDRMVSEADRCDPTELYSITKLSGTLYGQAIARQKDIAVVTLRIFTPYGPGIQPGRLVRVIIENALAEQDIKLSGREVSRDFLFIDDLVDLYEEVIERPTEHSGEVFNAGSGVSVTLKTLTENVLGITSSGSAVHWGAFPLTAYDRAAWRADMKKTFASFSWRPRFDLSQGIRETVDWLKQNEKKA